MVLKIGTRSAYQFDSDQEEELQAILKERAKAKPPSSGIGRIQIL